MPSFSLIRRFGKQHKAIVDSPVSSSLVEQHVSPTIAESSDPQIRQPSEAGNVFSSTRAANSHGLTSGLVALSQHMEGVSIGNIKGNMMSNNNININHYYGSAAMQVMQFAVLRVGDIYLEEEFERYTLVDHVGWTQYRGHIMTCSNMNMSIWTYRGEKAAEALEKFYKKYASLPRHPNILQLYGVCCSPHLTALVFHGTPHLLHWWMYYESLPSLQWIPHYIKLHKQYESAHRMLEAHSLRGYPLVVSDVDETGKLVIAHFIPAPTAHSGFDPRIYTTFETNTFIKEDLLDYYKFLFDMVYWSFNHHTSSLLSPLGKAAPFQLSYPEINLPVYSLPGWNKVVNEMDKTVQQTGIVLTLLPNMTIRCCIPTPQIPAFSIYEYMKPFEQTNITLFATWACQANHLIHDLPINIMDLQTAQNPVPDWKKDTESSGLDNLLETEHLYLFCPTKVAGNIYWSQDEEGHHVIEDSLIQAAFGITVDWHLFIYGHHIPPQFYQILQTIHEGCGFDPYSTQVAEYLGLPLVVTDSGHSGLEEYMEDPEYTSEYESGDSDCVSASEDV
ncbi:hypothetical protein C8J56DRAFT_1165062 [Mycena floridula]|nr:hypothetical protein C8J56DRAFT_1165062 [Mycena floridula]